MADFKVGQVLYVIPIDTAMIVPIQVTERRISETSSGTIVRHIIKSTVEKAKPKILESIKGIVFQDLQHVKEAMLKNASNAIDEMVKQAAMSAREAFFSKQATNVSIDDPLGASDTFIEDEHMQAPALKVGSTALNDMHVQSNKQIEFENVSIPDITQDGITEIMGPDGKMQKVRVRMS
jgi:uncharacterized protein YbjQ (UPF0145 family)